MRDRTEIRVRLRCFLRLLSMFCDLHVFEHDTNVCASLWNRRSDVELSKSFYTGVGKSQNSITQ
jgi:hypothetical protein